MCVECVFMYMYVYTRNPYTPHPTPYTLHATPYTRHPTPYTLNRGGDEGVKGEKTPIGVLVCVCVCTCVCMYIQMYE